MKATDEIVRLFREQGLRVTPQRQAIFALLQGNESHPTVDALFAEVRATVPTISLKTVYQTVHDLEALGQVRLLDVGTGSVRVDPNVEDDHQHLVCRGCGAVRDVGLDTGSLRLPHSRPGGFTVDAVEVIVRGRCEHCV